MGDAKQNVKVVVGVAACLGIVCVLLVAKFILDVVHGNKGNEAAATMNAAKRNEEAARKAKAAGKQGGAAAAKVLPHPRQRQPAAAGSSTSSSPRRHASVHALPPRVQTGIKPRR